MEAHLPALGDRSDALCTAADHLVGVERLEQELRLARLDHGQVEQLVDELGEVIGLALDLGGEVVHASLTSSTAPDEIVSARSLIDVIGVRSSCPMFATKSRRTRSIRRSAVMSWSERTSPPPMTGTASTAKCRLPRWPRSASP